MRKLLFFSSILVLIMSCSGETSKKVSPDKEVQLEYNWSMKGNSIVFDGTTNLPEGTKLGITVSNNEGYMAQDYDVFVKNQRFESTQFSNHGQKLVGKYNVEIICYFTNLWQTDEVLKKLKDCKGVLIKEEVDDILGKYKLIELNEEFDVRGAE